MTNSDGSGDESNAAAKKRKIEDVEDHSVQDKNDVEVNKNAEKVAKTEIGEDHVDAATVDTAAVTISTNDKQAEEPVKEPEEGTATHVKSQSAENDEEPSNTQPQQQQQAQEDASKSEENSGSADIDKDKANESQDNNNDNNGDPKDVDDDKKDDTAAVSREQTVGGDENPSLDSQKEETPPIAESTNAYDKIRWMIVENDGTPRNLIKLVALKSLFSKQLPKMPRTYIARLVFDRRHISLAILSDDPTLKDTDEEVIGAICFRAFKEMRFAEIAFCAVNASHQVKGYGTKLMNLLKNEAIVRGIEYFITYADNYATGYFKKQGFTKAIAMPKARYNGLIKDYDGGTMMECYVHPSIDYTRIPEMIAAQRQFLLDRIQLRAKSTKVYPPLPKDFNPRLEGVSRGNEAPARAMAIPGMVEAGWTLQDLISSTGQGKEADRAKSALKSELLGHIRKIDEQQFAWPFRDPVDLNEVKDYGDVVKEPIDLSTIEKRVRRGDYYKSKHQLYSDLILMVNNCKLYNDEKSTYVSCAISLEKFITPLFQDGTGRG